MPYIPHTEAERDAMLKTVGVESLDDLFVDIAPDLRPKSFLASAGLPEQEVRTLCEELSKMRREGLIEYHLNTFTLL